MVKCFVYVSVINKSEGEVKTWRQRISLLLSEHITYGRLESWQRHSILVTIGERHVTYHHKSACHNLHSLVPRLFFVRRFRGYCQLQRRSRINLSGNLYLVLIYIFIFYGEQLSVRTLCRHHKSFAVLAVINYYRSIRHQRYFLLETLLVLRQFFLFLLLILVVLFILILILVLVSLWRSPCILVKAFISLFQEREVVIQLLEVERTVYCELSVVRYYIS